MCSLFIFNTAVNWEQTFVNDVYLTDWCQPKQTKIKRMKGKLALIWEVCFVDRPQLCLSGLIGLLKYWVSLFAPRVWRKKKKTLVNNKSNIWRLLVNYALMRSQFSDLQKKDIRQSQSRPRRNCEIKVLSQIIFHICEARTRLCRAYNIKVVRFLR